ncbi:hypothetical protein NRB16_18860 [Pseudomonas sp. LJDD11]|nr:MULTISPECIES: hypothetical protein [unclassified Pseudomonas]MCQ9425581.1 hypothetical protein [Pseudomonas sp. LJDD11]
MNLLDHYLPGYQFQEIRQTSATPEQPAYADRATMAWKPWLTVQYSTG